jgi:hypothetical protein
MRDDPGLNVIGVDYRGIPFDCPAAKVLAGADLEVLPVGVPGAELVGADEFGDGQPADGGCDQRRTSTALPTTARASRSANARAPSARSYSSTAGAGMPAANSAASSSAV